MGHAGRADPGRQVFAGSSVSVFGIWRAWAACFILLIAPGSIATGALGTSGVAADPTDLAEIRPGHRSIAPRLLAPERPLSNPGIGIEQAARLLTPSGVLNVNKDVEAIATIRYIRLQWSLIEKDGDNQWNFAPLDKAIIQSAEDGKQAAIAIMGHVPKLGGRSQYTQAIPQWYIEAAERRGPRCSGAGDGTGTPGGCTHYLTDYRLGCQAGEQCARIWTFNHNDEEYIRQQIELIEALGERYDTPDWAGRIAYVDVRGGLGSWTENHVDGVYLAGTDIPWPRPSYVNKIRIADAYLAFTHLPILANVRNGKTALEAPLESQWVYLCQEARRRDKVVGWRTDGLDSTKYLIDAVFSAYPFTRDCWRQGPVHGELNGTALAPESPVNRDPWSNGRTQYQALNQRLAAWHVSAWNTKYHAYPDDAATYGAAIDEWRAIGGYRLAVAGGSIPDTVDAGLPLDIRIDLQNTGTAPVYRRWYRVWLRFHPRTDGGDILVPLVGDITSVLPEAAPLSFTTSDARLGRAGTYDISIGVVQDPRFTQVRPLKLAHDPEDCALIDESYWCALGSVQVIAGAVADAGSERFRSGKTD
ncbi:hypothetical protein CKO27_16070 [Thiocystis violacea]|nr:hypothetical protein [Thiocystis violacea]